MTLEIIVIVALGIMAVYGLVVSTALAAEEDNNTITKHFGSPRHIQTKDIEDAGDDKTVAEKNAKDGGDLTIVLKLTYSNLPGKYFKKVEISVGKYFGKFYNLSDKPGKVTIKHLDIPQGKVFTVHVNNYLTDDGEQVRMRNSICKCPETATIRVP